MITEFFLQEKYLPEIYICYVCLEWLIPKTRKIKEKIREKNLPLI